MEKLARTDTEVSFRLNPRNEATQIPLSLWTEVVTDGERILIRTPRPVPLLEALCASATANGADLPEMEVAARNGRAGTRLARADSES